MKPGKVYRVLIASFPMSNCFAVGHRIRIEVAGSNFPHFDINPGTDWRVEGLAPSWQLIASMWAATVPRAYCCLSS